MKNLVRMTDASQEPDVLPPGTDVVAGYIGGNTPHVWSVGEWERFPKVKKLPIYVATANGNGLADGWEALKRLYQLDVPKGTTVSYDLETNVWPTATWNFYNLLRWAGYYVWPYGSFDYIYKNPKCSGYWVAQYTDELHMAPDSVATQYQPGGPWDLSVVRSWQYLRRLRAW